MAEESRIDVYTLKLSSHPINDSVFTTYMPRMINMYMYICYVSVVHRYFRTEESKESVLVIPVGSVTAQTELTYEYGVRSKGRKHTEKAGEGKGNVKLWRETLTASGGNLTHNTLLSSYKWELCH